MKQSQRFLGALGSALRNTDYVLWKHVYMTQRNEGITFYNKSDPAGFFDLVTNPLKLSV